MTCTDPPSAIVIVRSSIAAERRASHPRPSRRSRGPRRPSRSTVRRARATRVASIVPSLGERGCGGRGDRRRRRGAVVARRAARRPAGPTRSTAAAISRNRWLSRIRAAAIACSTRPILPRRRRRLGIVGVARVGRHDLVGAQPEVLRRRCGARPRRRRRRGARRSLRPRAPEGGRPGAWCRGRPRPASAPDARAPSAAPGRPRSWRPGQESGHGVTRDDSARGRR